MAKKKVELESGVQLSFLTFLEFTPKDDPRQSAIREAMLRFGVGENEARNILMQQEREDDKSPYGSR